MFNYEKLGQVALSAIGAILLSAVTVGAAVGPARAIEATPVVGYALLQVDANA